MTVDPGGRAHGWQLVALWAAVVGLDLVLWALAVWAAVELGAARFLDRLVDALLAPDLFFSFGGCLVAAVVLGFVDFAWQARRARGGRPLVPWRIVGSTGRACGASRGRLPAFHPVGILAGIVRDGHHARPVVPAVDGREVRRHQGAIEHSRTTTENAAGRLQARVEPARFPGRV